VIVTQAVPVADIAVGDIVTLKSGDALVTHRVLEILYKEGDPNPWLRTKGDANQDPDPNLLSPKGDRAPKVVLHIPEMGRLSNVTQDKATFPFLVGIPGLILIAICVGEIRRGLREKEKSGKRSLVTTSTQDKR
jgi:signal peptidase